MRLADILRYVVSQRLITSTSGTRLLITEVVGNSLRTRETIRYGEAEGKTFSEIIEAGTVFGWHSFDQSLLRAFEAGQITEENALLYSTSKGKMRRELDLLLKGRGTTGGDEASASGLKLDILPPRVIVEVESTDARS
jgi:Tfp pilus assembly ATPase PilU